MFQRLIQPITRQALIMKQAFADPRQFLYKVKTKIKSRNSGYCHCCRQKAKFEVKGSWLRDWYVCLKCFSLPRQRHIQYVLDCYIKNWQEMNIHESSPSNDLISRHCSSYSYSQFFEGVKAGSLVNGVRCENLESLTFSDNSFDIFITQDVLEHVFNPAQAVREVMRVLKPGGIHIFTTPKHKDLSISYPRAQLVKGRITHLKEEAYHVNPIGDGKALVTWDYGDDFVDLVSSWSRAPTTTYITRDRSLGIDGEYIEVFVTRKPQSKDLS